MHPAGDQDHPIWRIESDGSALRDVLELLQVLFQYMDTRIDPPSSVHRLTVAGMRTHCQDGGEIWAIGRPLFGCMFLTPKAESLHLGKLAVQPEKRGQGICRMLVKHGERRAVELGLPALELETRVELTENHRAFSRLGFMIAGTGSHAGCDRPTEYRLRKAISSSVDS
ncbi:N-acetyltransferase [Ruegeria sp. EL01]|jgi:GNAT superfamily N-acetyltransferase|uniref:GNAT family N-acetyltransferase n=1 Tax=Ruegeria sp. EL01 TaxID=2107578 RepID=UPI000EA834A5|nr:GNAT family N-acetyltransferase [Ruegeria sp. EL01]